METVFETLTQQNPDDLHVIFQDKIEEIFEYDASEIQEYLLAITPRDNGDLASLQDILLSIRSTLHTSVKEKFAALANSELYNRRKDEKIAHDIYILGCCIVNNTPDKRIDKTLKSINGALHLSGSITGDASAGSAHSLSPPGGDILEVCVELKQTVKLLTDSVNKLSTEVIDLKHEVQRLKGQSATQENGATASTPEVAPGGDGDDAPNRSAVTPSAPPPPPSPPPPPPPFNPSSVDNNRILSQPRPNNDDQRRSTVATVEQGCNTLEQDDYQLPRSQRLNIQRGHFKATASKLDRTEVHGASDTHMHISGVAPSKSRSVYVGRLSSSTSVEKMRLHLRDSGINRISDVIKLNCRNPDQSSFCIVVDDETCERDMYNPDIWPKFVRIRPYTPKKGGSSKNYPSQSANVRQRRHQPNRQQKSHLSAATHKGNRTPTPNSNPHHEVHTVTASTPPQTITPHILHIPSNHMSVMQSPVMHTPMMQGPFRPAMNGVPNNFVHNVTYPYGPNRFSVLSDPQQWIHAM